MPGYASAVWTVLGRWASAAPDPSRASPSAVPALVVRLPLGDAEAAALLRDLYATGRGAGRRGPSPASTSGCRASGRPRSPPSRSSRATAGAFVPTWNWRAFVFGPLWYFRRGLYAKGLVLLGLSVCPFFTLVLTVLLSVRDPGLLRRGGELGRLSLEGQGHPVVVTAGGQPERIAASRGPSAAGSGDDPGRPGGRLRAAHDGQAHVPDEDPDGLPEPARDAEGQARCSSRARAWRRCRRARPRGCRSIPGSGTRRRARRSRPPR